MSNTPRGYYATRSKKVLELLSQYTQDIVEYYYTQLTVREKNNYNSYISNYIKRNATPLNPKDWHFLTTSQKYKNTPRTDSDELTSFSTIAKKLHIRNYEAELLYHSGVENLKRICKERGLSYSDFILK